MGAPRSDYTRKRSWLVALVLGLCALILFDLVVFQSTYLKTAVVVATALVLVVNVLLSPRIEESKNYSLQLVRSFLYVSRWLKVSTVVVWITVAASATFVISSYLIGGHVIQLTGNVLSARGPPVVGAQVNLFDGAKMLATTITRSGGDFSISASLRAKKRDELVLEVLWRNTRHLEKVFSVDQSVQQVVISLPPLAPPFRVSYLSLEGRAVDYLFANTQTDNLADLFGDGPFVVQNDSLRVLSSLRNEFSQQDRMPSLAGTIIASSDRKGSWRKEYRDESPSWLVEKELLVGTQSSLYEPENKVVLALSPAASWEIFTLVGTRPQSWDARVFGPLSVESQGAINLENLQAISFRKYADKKDLAFGARHSAPDSKTFAFYTHITGTHMPDGFLPMSLYHGSGCGSPPTLMLTLDPRPLTLKAVVIENIATEPLMIGNFHTKTNKTERLRTSDEDDEQLKREEMQEQKWFPLESLLPGERLVVPLAMVFEYPTNYRDEDKAAPRSDIDAGDESSLVGQLRSLSNRGQDIEFQYATTEERSTFSMDPISLVEALTSAAPSKRVNDTKYVYGPSHALDDIEIDGLLFPVRKADPNVIVIVNGSLRGSCPYVYTRSSMDEEWILEDRILIGRDSVDKEGVDELFLQRFDGEILLREEDPEISYIDHVYVRVRHPDGTEELLRQDREELRYADGDYLILSPGDEVALTFQVQPSDVEGAKATVGVKGYYVPIGAALQSEIEN